MIKNLVQFVKTINNEVGEKVSEYGVKYMKANTPVDTGNLRGAERSDKKNDKEWWIGDDENMTRLSKTYGEIKTYSVFANENAKRLDKKFFFEKTEQAILDYAKK